MATKKTSSTGTTRSRTKKNDNTPETPVSAANSGGAAVVPAREKITPTTSTSTASTGTPNFRHPAELQDRIRQRAFELYQKRGGQHGFDVEDWLRAEAEFKSR